MHIRLYVSAHGFGHATRCSAVLKELGKIAPDLKVSIRSAAPARIFFRDVELSLDLAHQKNDVGVVQNDGLSLDAAATLTRYRDFLANREPLLTAEAESLHRDRVDLVLGDIPPLAFRAAHRAGVRSVAMGNFDWSWIYASWPEAGDCVQSIRQDYALAHRLLRLPFHDRMDAFTDIEDVPLVGRRAHVGRTAVRQRIGLKQSASVVLLSFGGMGLGAAGLEDLGQIRDHTFISVGEITPPGGHYLSEATLHSLQLGYEDLVGAVDAVVTKPGYGIVSECAVNRTAMLYTDRGAFREYEIFERQIKDYFPALYVTQDQVRSGQLAEALDTLQTIPWPSSPPPADGALTVAQRLLELADS